MVGRRSVTTVGARELPPQVRIARRAIRSVVVAALSVTMFVGAAATSFAGTPAAQSPAAAIVRVADDGTGDTATTDSTDPGTDATDPGTDQTSSDPSTSDGSSSTDPGDPTDTTDPQTSTEEPPTTTDPGTSSIPADPPSDPGTTSGDPGSTTSPGGSDQGTGSESSSSGGTTSGAGSGTSSGAGTTTTGKATGSSGSGTSGHQTTGSSSGSTGAGSTAGSGTPTTILGTTIASGSTTGNPTTDSAAPDSTAIPSFVGTVTDPPATLGPFNDSFASTSSSTSGGVQDATTSCPAAGTATTVASDPADPVLPAGVYAGVHLTDAQAQTAQLIISVGKGLKITDRGVRIALAVALQESSLQPWVVSGPYAGLFQQLPDPTSGLYLDYDRYDATGATHMFYDQLVKVVPNYQTDPRSDWQIGEAVQQTGQGELFSTRLAVAQALTTSFFAKVPAYDFDPAPVATTPCTSDDTTTASSIGLGGFNPGDIISDAVFYNSTAMTAAQVRTFIASQGAKCTSGWCLKNITITTPSEPADAYCDAYQGAPGEDAATVITKVALACHVNPQVMLVTLQKESALLTRTDVSGATYAAAWGWHCPDSGPGGTANCDPQYAGFFAQAYGMAKQWARYKVDPGKYHYRAGQTAEVLWNVAESGCGGSDVHILNTATASLYNYTPYQPNAAALAAYPGVGDSCSAYGNRNFYYLFVDYFGGTGGGSPISVEGVSVTIPNSSSVPAALVGKTVTAPNAAVARGIAAGFAVLGTPYVWGGGTNGGPADNGCARGGGASNSCHGIIGFDCSGLTGYVLAQAGFTIPDNSAGQRSSGTNVPWDQALPGDIIGYPGHVAIYLGKIDGTAYLLEAPEVGEFVHIKAVYSGGSMTADSVLHRYWA